MGESPRRQAVLLDFQQSLEAVSSTGLRSSSPCLSDHRYTTVVAEETFRERKGRLIKKAVMFFTAVQEAS